MAQSQTFDEIHLDDQDNEYIAQINLKQKLLKAESNILNQQPSIYDEQVNAISESRNRVHEQQNLINKLGNQDYQQRNLDQEQRNLINEERNLVNEQNLIRDQENQIYQQQILTDIEQKVNNQCEKDIEQQKFEDQVMLDENDEIEIYADEQNMYKQSQEQKHLNHSQENHLNYNEEQFKQSNQEEFKQSNLNDQNQNQDQYIDILKSNTKLQLSPDDTDLEEETNQLQEILRTKYGHFNQDQLIKMLYEKLNPSHDESELEQTLNIVQQNEEKLKEELKLSIAKQGFQRTDFKSIKKTQHTVKIFVQHGYGISVARKFALKGETIQPNPYNNLICKVIKDTWKALQTEISKHQKIKPLSTDQFNQIKTPLVNSRTWMDKQYLQILNNVILYSHQLTTEKPTKKQFVSLYDYLIPKTKSKKHNEDRSFKKNKKNKGDDSDQFRPPTWIEKKQNWDKRQKYIGKLMKESLNKNKD